MHKENGACTLSQLSPSFMGMVTNAGQRKWRQVRIACGITCSPPPGRRSPTRGWACPSSGCATRSSRVRFAASCGIASPWQIPEPYEEGSSSSNQWRDKVEALWADNCERTAPLYSNDAIICSREFHDDSEQVDLVYHPHTNHAKPFCRPHTDRVSDHIPTRSTCSLLPLPGCWLPSGAQSFSVSH